MMVQINMLTRGMRDSNKPKRQHTLFDFVHRAMIYDPLQSTDSNFVARGSSSKVR